MSTLAVSASPRRTTETLFIVGTASVLSTLDLFVVNLAFSSLQASFPNTSNPTLIVLGATSFVLASAWWWTALDGRPDWLLHYLPASVLFGAGAGVTQTGFLAGGTAPLPASEYATGSAVLNTARQLGAALGVAAFVALSGAARAAEEYRAAWLAIVVFAILGGLCAFGLVPRRVDTETAAPQSLEERKRT